jgi:hypothetical protein
MNAQIRNCVLTVLAVMASAPAPAQVWRCGTTYSEQPCEGGRPMAAQDARSAAQQSDASRAARRAARRDARLAENMERDRLQHEAKLDKALQSTRKAAAARGRIHPSEDAQAWDFESPTEPIVARVPKPAPRPPTKAPPPRSTGRATMSR